MTAEETKDDIIKRFNEPFRYEMCGMPELDPLIKDFLINLNKNANIKTLYSCEGHNLDDDAYIFFSVNQEGWDTFFTKVLPDLALGFHRDMGFAFSQLEWHFSISSNAYNAGIAIHCNLRTNNCTWEQTKDEFWRVMMDVFNKHYQS